MLKSSFGGISVLPTLAALALSDRLHHWLEAAIATALFAKERAV